jgi:hypothetical protein
MLVIGLAVGAALALALGKTAGAMLFGLNPRPADDFAFPQLRAGCGHLIATCQRAARRGSIPWPPYATNKIFGWSVRDSRHLTRGT